MVDGRAVISDACRGCGRCIDVCPHQAIEMHIADHLYVQHSIDHLTPLVDVT